MRVALAQLISGADPLENLDLVEDYTRRAVDRGAELVVFPEATMCAFGNRLDLVAEPVEGPWVSRLTEIAESYGTRIVAGMFTPGGQSGPDGREKVINTLVATGDGALASYQKIHLYDAFGFAESDTVVAGTEPVIIDVARTKIGLTLCYDVRFPGLYQTLAERGADVIIVSASWGAGPGKVQQWQLLTQARALDSTCFILAAGQADPGTRGGKRTGSAPTGVGYSAVIDPTGGALIAAGAEPELLITDIDPGLVTEVRKIIPVLANRRF
jgi:predicted amidohydrolase